MSLATTRAISGWLFDAYAQGEDVSVWVIDDEGVAQETIACGNSVEVLFGHGLAHQRWTGALVKARPPTAAKSPCCSGRD